MRLARCGFNERATNISLARHEIGLQFWRENDLSLFVWTVGNASVLQAGPKTCVHACSLGLESCLAEVVGCRRKEQGQTAAYGVSAKGLIIDFQ